MNSNYDLLVVGAGLFGLTVAEHAARDGAKVLVLERRDHIGGNCYDELNEETGVTRHTKGSHLFHTSNERVWEYLNRFTEFTPYEHRVFANSQGQVYSFPMNLSLIAQVYGRYFTPDEARELIAQEASEIDSADAKNMEEKAISLIGRRLYDRFVKNYSGKQWQTDPKELDAGIITRLPVRYNFDNRYFTDRYQGQPSKGYTAMFEAMASHPNIEIRYGVDYFAERGAFSGVPTVYTGPLDEYFGYELGRLPWRTVDLVDEVVDVDDFQGTAVMNYNDADVPFTRILEHQHYDPQAAERKVAGKTLITREYSRFAEPGDEVYYPINSDSSRELAAAYKAKAKAEEENGVYFGGRLAQALYIDMWQAVNSAIHLYEKKLQGKLSIAESPSRTQQLRDLIEELVVIVREFGGEGPGDEIKLALAKRTGLSISDTHYIVNSAAADYRLEHSLRSGRIKLIEK